MELLMKLMQENPEMAKQLLENPELLKKLAENPELLQQLAQNPQQLQQVLQGAQAGLPMEFSGVSQFQSAPAAGPVSLG
jgi:glutamine synthetase adenylyltransferase